VRREKIGISNSTGATKKGREGVKSYICVSKKKKYRSSSSNTPRGANMGKEKRAALKKTNRGTGEKRSRNNWKGT